MEEKNVKKGYRLAPPLFMFKSGTAKSTSALMKYGPVDLNRELPFVRDWKKINHCLLFDPPFNKSKERVFNDLVLGSKVFDGLKNLFEVEAPNLQESKKLRLQTENKIADFDKLADGVDGFDVGLTFLDKPREHISRLHPLLKATFDFRGATTQLITRRVIRRSEKIGESNRNLRSYQNMLKNLATEIYAKIGGFPWTLSRRIAPEYFIGLSWRAIERTYLFATTVFNSVGIPLYDLFKTRFYDKTVRDFQMCNQNILEETLNGLPSDMRKITLHYHGSFFKFESQVLQILENYTKECFAIALERPAMPYFRLYDMEAKDNLNEKGICLVLDSKRFVLSTTGLPHFSIQGSPQSLLLESARELEESQFIYEANNIYHLAHLNWAHARGYHKLPVTTMLASNITKAITEMRRLRQEAHLSFPRNFEPAKYSAFW